MKTGLPLSTLLLFTLAAASGAEPPRVYVAPAGAEEQGLAEATPKELADSASDLREQLRKRKGLAIADREDSAEVLVIILDRRIEVGRNPVNYGGGHTQTHYESRHIIKYRIEAGGATHESEYYLAGSFVTWRRVAGGLSKLIERWALTPERTER